jgi:hypothetical protein
MYVYIISNIFPYSSWTEYVKKYLIELFLELPNHKSFSKLYGQRMYFDL